MCASIACQIMAVNFLWNAGTERNLLERQVLDEIMELFFHSLTLDEELNPLLVSFSFFY